jgi:hypothetical protein
MKKKPAARQAKPAKVDAGLKKFISDSVAAAKHRVTKTERGLSDPPNLEALVLAHGGYNNITPEAWSKYDRDVTKWQASVRYDDKRLARAEQSPPEEETEPPEIYDDDGGGASSGPAYRGERYEGSRRRSNYPGTLAHVARAEGESEALYLELEERVLLSTTIRADLRHLMSHGHCRYEISQRLYDGFKAAHDGIAPENMEYVMTEHHKTKTEYVVREGRLAVKKTPIEESGVKDWHAFDLGEKVGCDAMQELTQWLDTPEGHAFTGWYSFGEWRGPPIMKELAAWRDFEEAEREKRKAGSRQRLANRLKLFDSILSGKRDTPRISKSRIPSYIRDFIKELQLVIGE